MLLDIQGVSKTWPRAPKPVLDAVDLALDRGTFAVVEGANGAGKTTLLRVVAGMMDADSGQVLVHGSTARGQRAVYQRQIGVASAGNSALYARLSARQNLLFCARIGLVARARCTAVVDDLIGRFGIDAFELRRVDRLSMGQRQRVRLAAAFAHEPALALLDEPTTSLDEEARLVLATEIARHRSAGGGVLWFAPTGEMLPRDAGAKYALRGGSLLPR